MKISSINNRVWSDLCGTHLSAREALVELGLTAESSEAEVEAALRFLEASVGEHLDDVDCDDDEERALVHEARNEAFARMARGLLQDAT